MQLEDYVIKLKKLDLSSNKVKDLLYLFIQVDIFGEEAFSKKNIIKVLKLSFPTLNKAINELVD